MNAITKPDGVVGERKIDVSRGECRGDVSVQWASRPRDQRYLSLDALFDACNHRREHSFDLGTSPRELKFKASRDDTNQFQVITEKGEITPTHYAFGQLCSLAKAPAAYLRGMHGFRAALNLQTDMLQRAEDLPVRLYGEDENLTARAFTGPTYGRIFDADLVDTVRKFAGDGSTWKVPGQIDWSKMTYNPYVTPTADSTTLYASDRDVFIFLVDDTRPIEIGKLANGDPDLIFRGFYAYNSEVGARSLGIATFWLRGVCFNRNLWGVEDFDHLRIIHSQNGNVRFEREAAPALEHYAKSDPTKLLAGITAAKQAIVAHDEEERLKFLTKDAGLELSLKMATKILDVHLREEGRHAESIFDMCQGLTAVARDIPNQDDRIEMERLGARLMKRATQGAF